MRKLFVLCIVGLLLVAQTQAWGWGSDDEQKEEVNVDDDDEVVITEVTCGSVIKLRHVATGVRLHSHQVTYGSGSGQQSVTGYPHADDPNSLWLVAGPVDKHCPTGTVLKNGDYVRLQHVNTGKNLHSHLHRSPLTNQQEVSAFGESGKGDTGDNWKLVTSGKTWKRDTPVSFQHIDTGKWLSSNKNKYGHPIPGQQEICAISGQTKDA